ncbi:MAG: hypothetical protein WEB58_06550 [Planctomycetaceae bacterium]
MSIRLPHSRSDAETEALIERHGLREHLEALNEITQEVFGSGIWLSASQADDVGALVVHVSIGEDEDPKKIVELESVWFRRVEQLIGETMDYLRLVVRYQ